MIERLIRISMPFIEFHNLDPASLTVKRLTFCSMRYRVGLLYRLDLPLVAYMYLLLWLCTIYRGARW